MSIQPQNLQATPLVAMPSTLPNKVSLDKWADTGFTWQGTIQPNDFTRLKAVLTPDHEQSAIEVKVQLTTVSNVLELSFQSVGQIWMTCQRCLQPIAIDLTDDYHIELLEERAVVSKERLDVGKVTVTKHQRTKTIQVPVELVEEVLTIKTDYYDADSKALLTGSYDEQDILRHVEPSLETVAVVTVNGKRIEVGNEPVEIVLSRQVATIAKETYAVQEIDIEKSIHTHTDTIAVKLKYEELDVKEEGFLDHKAP